MFIGDLGRWIENMVFAAFLLVNFGGVIGFLIWALAPDKTPAPREHEDKGMMTAEGVPYVPGPPRT